MNSSLDFLIKNLSNNDFKYLSQESSDNLLKIVKQKGVYVHQYLKGFKKPFDEKLRDIFFIFKCSECV